MIQNLYNNNKILEKSLDAAWARNDTIAQNLSNIDTPTYKRKDVAFEQYLNDSLGKSSLEGQLTDKRHIPIHSKDIDKVEPTVTEDSSDTSMRIDGNNVDIDNEMSYMAKNTIKYNTLVQLINGSYSRIKNVIAEGRR